MTLSAAEPLPHLLGRLPDPGHVVAHLVPQSVIRPLYFLHAVLPAVIPVPCHSS